MAKILLTGMTASQASPRANERAFSYAGMVNKVLTDRGHTVDWGDVQVDSHRDDFASYDAVMVGLAPVTSLAANRAYGALSAVENLFGDSRLVLFLDAPRPELITQSLRSVLFNPGSLFKDFFSYRPGFAKTSDPVVSARLHNAVRFLLQEEWPTTIYPQLPWYGTNVVKALPEGATHSIRGINLDSTLGIGLEPSDELRKQRWLSETIKGPWIEKAAKNIMFTIKPMKEHKSTTDAEVLMDLSESVGAIIPPQRNGETWWSFRYAQAMHTNTPIATEWRQSSRIGAEWSVLPGQIEDMTHEERNLLAFHQRASYLLACGDRDEVVDYLLKKVLQIGVQDG